MPSRDSRVPVGEQRLAHLGASRWARAAVGLSMVLGLTVLGSGCSRDKLARQGGQVSRAQADAYLRDAVRKSSEGVLLEPSQVGLEQIERTRLGEIAQQLRTPAAVCFLERAILVMEPGEVDGEQAWLNVPEGQAKFRARIAVDGSVLTTELLESGFNDEKMEACLQKVFTDQVYVESRDSFAYFIDIYYWVSLGFFAEAQSGSFEELLRRRQAEAGRKARPCLIGRVEPGTYEVSGLNLFDREGRTMVNRIDRGELPKEVGTCVASVFKQIAIHPEPEAFVRPAAPVVQFTVAGDGSVSASDERWLSLIELEEQAERERKRAELLEEPIGGERPVSELVDGGEPPAPSEAIDAVPRNQVVPAPSTKPAEPAEPPAEAPPAADEPETPPAGEPESPAPTKPAAKPKPQGDPSKPGVKIDLSPRR